MYAAYWDYHDVMAFTERMLTYVAEQVLGQTTLIYDDHEINDNCTKQRRFRASKSKNIINISSIITSIKYWEVDGAPINPNPFRPTPISKSSDSPQSAMSLQLSQNVRIGQKRKLNDREQIHTKTPI